MLMRTPVSAKPGLGARLRGVIERLRDLKSSLATSASSQKSAMELALEDSDESNFDVALAAIVDSIERHPRASEPRFKGLPPPRSAPSVYAYERPSYLDMERQAIERHVTERQVAERQVSAYPQANYTPDAASDRTEQEDELQQLRKELMHAVSARLGSPDAHLAAVRHLLRSVKNVGP
ncbi:hypothetical protein ACQR1I_24470 [Bradyrhizobium sp. HKCCYLS2038]|uniref:hypothetical protein n=1 Tax=unclassified Bradyrhizobium TaxID=2631580 RepID=UPI003EBAE55A